MDQLLVLLKEILGSDNVYFQPPPSLTMAYPCIVFNRMNMDVAFANNSPYRLTQRYMVTLIDRDPENPAIEKLASLPMCRHDRWFASDNLNHDVFNLYFKEKA